jgi:hypothetical protein
MVHSRYDLQLFAGLLLLRIAWVQSFQGKFPFIVRTFVKLPSFHGGVKIYSRPRDFGGGSSLEQEVLLRILVRSLWMVKLILSD